MTQPSSSVTELNALIDDGLNAPLWKMVLPGELEERFSRQQFFTRFNHTLRSGWLALMIFNSFLLVDWLLVQDVFWEAVLVRVVVFTPLCLIILLTGNYFFKPDLDLWNAKPRLTDWLITLTGWAAAACLAVIVFQSRSPYAPLYHAGFMVVILYGNLVQKLNFKFAIVFTLGVQAISFTFMQLTPYYPEDLQATITLLLSGVSLITLVSNFLAEKIRRRFYLLQLQEQTLVQELSQANEQLQKISRSDVLTGLYNRRHFHDYLANAWQRAEISKEPVAVLMMDVDHFKPFNDHYGHQAGDECLKQVAMALEDNLRRPGDMVARYGGEEFVAVLPNTGPREALQAAARVRRGVEHLMMRHEYSDAARVVTISIGIGVGSSDNLLSLMPHNDQLGGAERLLACADQALYEAKNAGRNCVKLVARLEVPPT
jgi:diguanylate cyclase (GGDEF)-like protein